MRSSHARFRTLLVTGALLALLAACSGGNAQPGQEGPREPVVLAEADGYTVTAIPVDLLQVEVHGGQDLVYAATDVRYTILALGKGPVLTDPDDDPTRWQFHGEGVEVGTDAPQVQGMEVDDPTPVEGWALLVEPEGMVDSVVRDQDQPFDPGSAPPLVTRWRPVGQSGSLSTYLVGGAGPVQIAVTAGAEGLTFRADLDRLS